MGKDKKKLDEKLQEIRTKHTNKVRYQKRKIQESEAKEAVKEYKRNDEPF